MFCKNLYYRPREWASSGRRALLFSVPRNEDAFVEQFCGMRVSRAMLPVNVSCRTREPRQSWLRGVGRGGRWYNFRCAPINL